MREIAHPLVRFLALAGFLLSTTGAVGAHSYLAHAAGSSAYAHAPGEPNEPGDGAGAHPPGADHHAAPSSEPAPAPADSHSHPSSGDCPGCACPAMSSGCAGGPALGVGTVSALPALTGERPVAALASARMLAPTSAIFHPPRS